MTSNPEPRQAVFDRERAFHDAWAADTRWVQVRSAFENLTAPENRFLITEMGDLRGQRVLDLGSGLGEAAIYFALQGARVTATDISPEMCALCRSTARAHGIELEVVETPAERLEVPPASHDIVYGANILHHVADIDLTLKAVERALKPGGRCFFWDPLSYNPVIKVYRRLSPKLHTEDEHPLSFQALDLLRRYFVDVRHKEFWLTTQVIFLKYYLIDGLDPNEIRYWKRILQEQPARISWWFGNLQRLDEHLLRLPLVRRLAWNIVIWGRKPA